MADPDPMPTRIEPALAVLVPLPPDGGDWIHEIKFDGHRALAFVQHGHARLLTRRGNDCSERFAEIVGAVASLPVSSAILDGEIVALDERGVADFGALATRRSGLHYQVFDLLYLDGKDLRPLPLLERKEALRRLLLGGPLRYTDHVAGHGPAFHVQACRIGLEGTVSKRADAPYVSGRSRVWLKAKRLEREQFVVAGYTDPTGSRSGFGALLLATPDEGGLRYVGRVGTGFTDRSLAAIRACLRERATSPLRDPLPEVRGVHWVEPEWEADVQLQEWTADGRLRGASFKGLRAWVGEPAAAR